LREAVHQRSNWRSLKARPNGIEGRELWPFRFYTEERLQEEFVQRCKALNPGDPLAPTLDKF
jgi:hypothetical protein